MQISTEIPLLENIFSQWKELIADDYLGYRNHCYRMIHCCFALHDCTEEEKQKVIIAAAFHDIGIWIENTVDYIPPSLPPARQYLIDNDLEAWSEEIELMITEHHKLREYKDTRYPLVEVFRKGDLVDFSLGLKRFGVSKQFIKELKATFPNQGFHKGLLKKGGKWFLKHPLNPAPMMKW